MWIMCSETNSNFHKILSSTKAVWDNLTLQKAHDLVAPEVAWTSKRIEATLESLLSDIALNPHMRVLELGCGLGRLLKPLAQKYACSFCGIDLSQDILAYAKDSLEGLENVFLKQNDGVTIPFEDESFDFCFSVCVFQHIGLREVQKKYVREAYRVLKPGGVFKLQHLKGDGREYLNGYNGYTPRDLEDLKELLSPFINISITPENIRGSLWYWNTCIK